MEKWKPIKGYENIYEISDLGRIKSLKTNKIRKTLISKRGYYTCSLCKHGKHKTFSIHRLLLEAFVPNLQNKPCVDHIDGNRLNNKLSNLRWCTHKENNNNPNTKGKSWKQRKEEIISKIMETRKEKKERFAPKVVFAYNKDGSFYKSYCSINEAARQVGCSPKSIQLVLDNNSKIVCGFVWSSIKRTQFEYVLQINKNQKVVQQIDKNGNVVKEWEKAKNLAFEIKARNYENLTKYIRARKPYKGVLYVYKD